jgi:4-hydroxybenzoate polyprenyltransferase
LSFLKRYKFVVITLLVVVMIEDILFIRFKSDLITFTVLGLIVIFFKFYKWTTKRIFFLCFIPVAIMFVMFFTDSSSIVLENAAIWLYLLMGVGIVWELFRKGQK